MARLDGAGLGAALMIAGAGCHCGGTSGIPAPEPPVASVSSSASATAPGGAPAASASAAATPPPRMDPAPIEELLREARRGGARDVKFVAPGEDEAKRHGELVAALARRATAAPPPSAASLAAEAGPLPPGIVVKPLPGRDDLIAVIEDPGRRRGAGALVLRIGPAARVLVEAPHTFYDEGTLPLGIAAFDGLRARALLVNTVHRYAATKHKAPGDEDEGGSASDVAHAAVSHFQSAHDALLDAEPPPLTIQLHGFGNGTVEGVDVVLSAARTRLDLALFAAKLREALSPSRVQTYPDEIQKLGGTTNIQAAASKRRGAPFLHVELSRAQRDRLEKDAAPLVEALRAALPADVGGAR